MDSFKVIKDKYFHTLHDIAAETFVAQLMQNGVALNNIEVEIVGDFDRKYQKDIRLVEKQDDTIFLQVRRAGIFDALPQTLIHSLQETTVKSTNQEMLNAYYKRRKEEEVARMFFNPLDQECFKYKALNRFIDLHVDETDFTEFLTNFWKVERALPPDAVKRFIALIPYANEIQENLELTAEAIGSVIGEQVELVVENATIDKQVKSESINNWKLGVNSFAGNTLKVNTSIIHLKVMLNAMDNLTKYINGGEYKKLLNLCINYFIPIEFETRIDIDINQLESGFSIFEENSAIVGYSTVI